jgi:hypothetical protein
MAVAVLSFLPVDAMSAGPSDEPVSGPFGVTNVLGVVAQLLPAPTPRPPIPTPGRGTISMNANAWNILYSKQMPVHPSESDVGWYFDFPRVPGSVHYVTTSVAISASDFVKAEMEVRAASGTVFDHRTELSNTGDFPAHARFFLQRRGDNMTGRGAMRYYRWWANPQAFKLENGAMTLTVPLSPSEWSSVYGEKGDSSPAATKGFQDALADLSAVGLTFGGGNFFGHGVRVSAGAARFYLRSFEVR